MPEELIKSIVSKQIERYPGMLVQDLYKLVYQGVMGSGHAVTSVADAEKWLSDELLSMGECRDDEVAVERLSSNMVRVNLRPFVESRGDTAALLDGFIRTGREYSGNISNLILVWKTVAGIQNLFSLSEMTSFITGQEDAGFPATHHSQIYRELYRPAYRVVAEKILLLLKCTQCDLYGS